jgi:predicted glycosyltransferase
VACAGGGEDGARLLRTFVAASRDVPWRPVVVIGPLASEGDHRELERIAADSGVEVHGQAQDLGRWFTQVDAVVGMGGYNTVVEAAAAGCPMVCVPRIRPRREQLIRAHAFARHRLLLLIEPGDLSAARLAAAVASALQVPRDEFARRVAATLDLNGARRAADVVLSLCADQARRVSA